MFSSKIYNMKDKRKQKAFVQINFNRFAKKVMSAYNFLGILALLLKMVKMYIW